MKRNRPGSTHWVTDISADTPIYIAFNKTNRVNRVKEMKKISILLCMLLLCVGLFSACGSQSAEYSIPIAGGAAVPPAPELNVAPPAANNPQISEAAYFVVGGHLVGSWENGAWRSLNDPEGRYEKQYSNDFYFKDVLSRERFALYSRRGKVGCSDFALINGGAGVSGFENGDKTELFAPYAKPDPGNLWPNSMEIKLPAAFGPEIDDLKIPDFGYSIRFSYENIDLATNSADDLNTCGKVEWGSHSLTTDRDHAALKDILSKNRIYGETHFDDSAMADIDGDGAQEVLLFAGTPTDEAGYLKISPEDGGNYSVILLCRADGSYETVYKRYREYTSDATAHFGLRPLGIFDLNGDGEYEICADMVEWEGGYTFVLSRDETGKWQTVLRANWGT